jgi:hypothetical protein
MRRIFNDLELAERVAKNELLAVVETERSARPEAQQPPGTRSQMIWYYTKSLERVALVHQYSALTDPSVGAASPIPNA